VAIAYAIVVVLKFLAKFKKGFRCFKKHFYASAVAVNSYDFSIIQRGVCAQNIEAFAMLIAITNKDNFKGFIPLLQVGKLSIIITKIEGGRYFMSVSNVKYFIADIKPGMQLGRSVINEEGRVVLSKHVILTDSMILRLIERGYTEVDIEEDEISNYSTKTKIKRQYFAEEYAKIVYAVKDAFNKTRDFKEVPYQQMNKLAEQTICSLLDMNAVISYLHLVNTTDDYTFRHSVNVGVIAGIIGKLLKWEEKPLVELVLCGLLHDVGKTRIPLEILNKPTKLLDYEMIMMKEHSSLGYELIAGSHDISHDVKLGILQHHERLDGSGYPNQLKGDDIFLIARIVAVADVYDAITSTRIYHHARTPLVAVKELLINMFGKFDPKICMIFTNRAQESLLGSLVRLSNGSIARIIYMNCEQADRPIVQTTEGQYIELETQRSIEIVNFI